jgi:hypothetical protein
MSARIGPAAFSGAVLLLAAAGLSAQDVFDASTFDQAVQQSTQLEQKAGLETQFGGNLLFDNTATTTVDAAGYGAQGSFSGKAFVKVSIPDYGAVYLAYNFSKNLYQGAGGSVPGEPLGPGGPVLAQPAGDLFGAAYALAEFYTSFDISQAVFFRVGNQLLAWGPSIIWTPVDFVNLQRVNPLTALDLRVGKPGIRVTVPLGISNLFLFADMSATVASAGGGEPLAVNDLARSTNVAARWDITILGVEFGLTGYAGETIQNRAGLDFSSRVLGVDVYGEAAAALPRAGYTAGVSTSVGFQKTLGELNYWSLAGEFFYNSAGTSDLSAYSSLAQSGNLPFYAGVYYVYAGLTRTHLFVDGLGTGVAWFMDLSDRSFLGRLFLTVGVPRVPPFTFSVSWAGGGAARAFTWFTGNNSLTAEIQMRAEF